MVANRILHVKQSNFDRLCQKFQDAQLIRKGASMTNARQATLKYLLIYYRPFNPGQDRVRMLYLMVQWYYPNICWPSRGLTSNQMSVRARSCLVSIVLLLVHYQDQGYEPVHLD